MDKGNVNKNWLIETERKKFVLKELEKTKNGEELQFEISYLNYFHQKKFPYRIPGPVRTINGESYIDHRGTIYWVYNFIEGKITTIMDDTKIKEIAKMVALYHELLESSPYSYGKKDIQRYNTWILQELREYRRDLETHDYLNSSDKILESYGKRLEEILITLNKEKCCNLKTYAIHRDLRSENLLWNNNKLIGIIDFENVPGYQEPFVKDLSVIISNICKNKEKPEKSNIQKVRTLLETYRRLRPNRDEELGLVTKFMINGLIEDFNFAYWQTRNDSLRSNISKLLLLAKAAIWHFENREKLKIELQQ